MYTVQPLVSGKIKGGVGKLSFPITWPLFCLNCSIITIYFLCWGFIQVQMSIVSWLKQTSLEHLQLLNLVQSCSPTLPGPVYQWPGVRAWKRSQLQIFLTRCNWTTVSIWQKPGPSHRAKWNWKDIVVAAFLIFAGHHLERGDAPGWRRHFKPVPNQRYKSTILQSKQVPVALLQ